MASRERCLRETYSFLKHALEHELEVDALRQENEDLKKEREELRSTIDELNTRLTQGAEEED